MYTEDNAITCDKKITFVTRIIH